MKAYITISVCDLLLECMHIIKLLSLALKPFVLNMVHIDFFFFFLLDWCYISWASHLQQCLNTVLISATLYKKLR